jgi:hypothetical protein
LRDLRRGARNGSQLGGPLENRSFDLRATLDPGCILVGLHGGGDLRDTEPVRGRSFHEFLVPNVDFFGVLESLPQEEAHHETVRNNGVLDTIASARVGKQDGNAAMTLVVQFWAKVHIRSIVWEDPCRRGEDCDAVNEKMVGVHRTERKGQARFSWYQSRR